jgi:hypothetical protein
VCSRRQRRAEVETVCASTASASPYRYFWKAKYGGPEVSDPWRQKRLEDENRRLKTFVAASRLDNQMLKSVVQRKVVTPAERRLAWSGCKTGSA